MDIYLKQASPTAANIHNRWWRERSERNLRIFTAKPSRRPRRGRTQASCSNTQYVRPLRGRFHHHHGDRRLRCLRLLNQRLWIFALFEDASAAQPAVKDIRPLLALASDKVKREDGSTIIMGDRRLRSLRLLNQRLWIFAAVGDAYLR